jgi:hypothetical protein
VCAPDAPVILVGTHSDNSICNERFTVFLDVLCFLKLLYTLSYLMDMKKRLVNVFGKRFANIVAIRFVSCATGRNLDNLLHTIQHTIRYIFSFFFFVSFLWVEY